MGIKQERIKRLKKICNDISKNTYEKLCQEFSEIHLDKIQFDLAFSPEDLNIENRINKEEIANINPEQKEIIRTVINKLKNASYNFSNNDINILNVFTGRIDYLLRGTSKGGAGLNNRINNIKDGKSIDGKKLDIVLLFNEIKANDSWKLFEKNTRIDDVFWIKKNGIQPLLPYLFSLIKNCQDKVNYPLFYKQWQLEAEYFFNVALFDYDAFCNHYRDLNLGTPKLLHFSNYYFLLLEKLKQNSDYLKITEDAEEKAKIDELIFVDKKPNIEKPEIPANKSLFYQTKDKFENSIFENYIKFLRKINSELGLMPYDERVVYSVRDNRLNFTVGQRYSFNLYLNDSRGIYGVISKEKLLDSSEPYDGNPPQPFYNYYTDFEPSNKDWSSITEAIKDELNRTSKSGFVRHNNSDFENYVFELSKETVVNNDNMKLSLNTILYGPPGTGKTHILKNQYMDMFTTSESSITRQDFLKDIIQNCSWWQVIALAVLELGKTKVADIFNHEYVQVKAQLSNSTTVTPTIWGQLQSHTVENCEHVKVARRMPPMIFNKTEKSEWEILQNEVEEQSPELLELKSKIENFESVPNKRIERFEFLTFHQSYSYEDFIEGIKPELAESDVSYKIEEGVFQKMCNRARNDSSYNYAIFIDEINRGNISSIFGELITLIEDDKREGKPNEIKATLPYSKKHFSVPNNLYIIGTMNTADRSVEALDTALRRRFSFIEMNPESEKLNTDEFKCSGIDLAALLNAINARIEKLLDKDYCIGHSYFMTIKNRQEPLEEIKNIFQNKILPLLQEYFYGDWGKILLVIGKEFVETKENTIKFLSTDSYEDFEEYDEKPIYNFTKPSSWTIESFKSIYE